MKKTIAILLCAAISLGFAACGSGNPQNGTDQAGTSGESAVQSSLPGGSAAEIPNPFVDCETMEEASKIAGFDFTVPDSVSDEYTERGIRAMADKLIEVIDRNEEDQVRMRKAPGTEDISGDYNAYTETNSVKVGDLDVTMKGSDGKVQLAIWTSGEYTYSISASKGMDSGSMSELVGAIQ